jgi:hypothetical protein
LPRGALGSVGFGNVGLLCGKRRVSKGPSGPIAFT